MSLPALPEQSTTEGLNQQESAFSQSCWLEVLVQGVVGSGYQRLSPWLRGGHLILSPHGLPSMRFCVLISVSSSSEDTSHIGLGPTLRSSS